jgi:hypothetical protein
MCLHHSSKPQWFGGSWSLKCYLAQPPGVAVTAIVFYCMLEGLSSWFIQQNFASSVLHINVFLSARFSPSVFVCHRYTVQHNLYVLWHIHKFLSSMLGPRTANNTDLYHYVLQYFSLLSQFSNCHSYNLLLCCFLWLLLCVLSWHLWFCSEGDCIFINCYKFCIRKINVCVCVPRQLSLGSVSSQAWTLTTMWGCVACCVCWMLCVITRLVSLWHTHSILSQFFWC